MSRPQLAAWESIDEQLTRTFIFSVALNSVNALEPNERGVVFLATMGLVQTVLFQLQDQLRTFLEIKFECKRANPDAWRRKVDAAWLIADDLLGYFLQIVVSIFSTASGVYVSSVMGTSIIERPVYALIITGIIVAVLYLVKDRLKA